MLDLIFLGLSLAMSVFISSTSANIGEHVVQMLSLLENFIKIFVKLLVIFLLKALLLLT